MADEAVMFENSPLQKYLDEIGFTECEKVKSDEIQRQEKHIFSFGTWIRDIFECFKKKTKTTWESMSWFALTPSKQDLEAFRKDYVVAVTESQILNEDDFGFLSRFDPELFESRRPCKSREWDSFLSRRYILSSFLVLVSVILLSSGEDFVFSSLSVALALLIVTGFESLIQYYFSIQHRRNLRELKLFTIQIKQLVLLLRKCIKLIQEMEVLSKGYTMVGPGSPAFFESYDNFIGSTIYPALRENVVKNTEHVVTCLQKSAKELLLQFSLSKEFTEIFTYFSTQSVEYLCLGSGKVESERTLQGLKNRTLVIVSLQSEFLSRLLLSLSFKANSGDLYELYFNLFTNIYKVLGMSSKVITTSVTSVERCFHLHESFCFVSEVAMKHATKPCIQSTAVDTVLRSLQLHLQAGILRVQSLQQGMRKLSKSEEEQELKATNSSDTNSNLSVSFQWLKSDLESALTCWQEGERHLNKMLGKEVPFEEVNNTSYDAMNNVTVKESEDDPCTLDFKEEYPESNKAVYEAFSDPPEEADLPRITNENLERDKNEARKNKQLLQELKAVLFTKDKDPLIDASGFVQPVKPSVYNTTDSLNVNDDIPHAKEKAKKISNSDKWSDPSDEKLLRLSEASSQLPGVERSKHPNEQHTFFTNLQSSVAASAAAMAVTQNKNMELYEDSFISDNSD